MKAIMLMFDTLVRDYLPPYGCHWVHAPNFQRLSQLTVTFDNCYVGSMPCMPARRELHTGRYNFMHRSWGPLEPFDDSMPEILKINGIYTHLITDHMHYWDDGGCTYHSRYNTFELIRGQEGDPWKGRVRDPYIPNMVGKPKLSSMVRQDWVNRQYINDEDEFMLSKTVSKGIEFIETNHDESSWFLQIECFDPHEPFFAPQKYRDLYSHSYEGLHFDWPPYGPVRETTEQIQHIQFEYAALLSMCDNYLGKILDLMDELNLWEDTMLIVNTDHGFLLGEHGEWAKCVQPFFNEVAHIPLFIWDPRSGKKGERRSSLVQMIDMAPTLLDYFEIKVPPDMLGSPLKNTIHNDTLERDAILFGIHGGHINITDGRYVYIRGAHSKANLPLYNYTLMPTHMRKRFTPEELINAELSKPFSFTKGVKPLKIEGTGVVKPKQCETALYDLQQDPQQIKPFRDHIVEHRLINKMLRIMKENDAPVEQYERLGI